MKIEELIEGELFSDDPREYLGISEIGEPCKRALWYNFRSCTKKAPITARKQRLFNRGHFEELVVLNDLVKHGVVKNIEIADCVKEIFSSVFDHELPNEKQKKVEFAHGHGSGHGDGLYIFEKQDLLLEFKTSNTKGFNDLKRDKNLKRSKPVHYIQAQGYMYLYGLKKCIYIMVCKETDERIYIELEIDEKFIKKELDIASQVIFMKTPPEKIGDSNFYRCRPYICKITGVEELFCAHRHVCHLDKRYQKTCRTCKNVEMHDKGRWFCSKKGKFLSFKKQLKACKGYEVLT